MRSDFDNKIKKKIENQNFIIIVILLIFQSISNLFRDNTINSFNELKFVILFLAIVIFGIEFIFNRPSIYYLGFEIKVVFIWYITLLFISVYWMFKNNTWNNRPLLTGSLRLLLPILFSFLAVNLISEAKMYKALCIFLVISLILFLINEIIKGNFSFKEIFSLSLTNSSGSKMESNFFSPVSFSLSCYFGYFRKKKLPLILSVIFSILTYKRFMAMSSIFLLLFGGFFKKKKDILWLKIIIGFIFFGITIWYIKLNLGKINSDFVYRYLGEDLNTFTMGRTSFFQNIYFNNFPKSGLFSILNTSFQNPEMDFPVMYLEMGYSSIAVSIFALVSLVRKSLYNLLIIILVLFEILTSHFLDITFFWIILYITIGTINKNSNKDKIIKTMKN